MLFPSHSITLCGEINSLAPCEGKQFPGNLEDETGMQSLFALSQHQPYGESLPYNTQKKATAMPSLSIGAALQHTKTILYSLRQTAAFGHSRKIEKTLPSPTSLKGGGVCGGTVGSYHI